MTAADVVTEALARMVVAIDGPSGSGKSTVARGTARQLGLRYLDTGAMYRALTWLALRTGTPVDDQAAVTALTERWQLAITTDPEHPTVAVDGRDITAEVRSPEVTAAVSAVSAVPQVRDRLVALQREIAGPGGIVAEGRDTGSVVFPAAAVKIYLTASGSARAERRARETAAEPATGSGAVSSGAVGSDRLDSAPRESATPDSAALDSAALDSAALDSAALDPAALDPAALDSATLASTRADLERRDRLDSTRQASPLTKAPDALEVDTTSMSVDEAIEAVVRRCLAAASAAQPESARPRVTDLTRAGRSAPPAGERSASSSGSGRGRRR